MYGYGVLALCRALSAHVIVYSFSFYSYRDHRDLHSFPTRRSSDLPFGLKLILRIDLGDATDLPVYPRLLWSIDHGDPSRSEEHTSELQSQFQLVCRLLLEKKNDYRATRVGAHSGRHR